MNNIIETEIDIAKQLFKARMCAKTISQLSFELREIDKSFPADYYEMNSAEQMLGFYKILLAKVLEISKDIVDDKLI